MKRSIRYSFVIFLSLITAYSPTANIDDDSALKSVIAGQHRSGNYVLRDKYRHPLETLKFFDVQPDMSVVEIWPGGGWYTEILAPYLKDNGKYYAAGFNEQSNNEKVQRYARRLKDKLGKKPELYGKTIFTALEPPYVYEIAPANSVDRVLTFRNIHNWMEAGHAEEVFESFYTALKPGGVLGVVEHRLGEYKKQDLQAKSGYVKESYVVRLAEKAGFKLVAKSEVNANKMDSTRHPKGVWTLPPSLALGNKDKAKYEAIGESDRMTLKFVKPTE